MLVICGIALIGVLRWDTIALVAGWGLPERAGPQMLVIAHRGDMESLPEDTAEAIWAAAGLGADGIEFDVHQSADGTWWVMHDATVDRTTGGSGAIQSLDDRYLEGLGIDAGPGFDPSAEVVEPPLLETVLDGLAEFEGEIYVDLQHAEGEDIRSLMRALDDAPDGLLLWVICRDETDVKMIHDVGSDIGTVIRINRVGLDSNADAFLLESFREVSPARLEAIDRPIVTFNDDAYTFLGEAPMLRRAWALGVHAFLAKRLREALELRDSLEKH